ncbi:uncharacterized protein N7459_006234 [Penicillium hispanicum]|uniref:uncharacterized protein n=1 Tax=Penicillium hispanicum TaxID=1080232 RepID=UPI00253F8741|nr:uncharacterized protein N7459_006234 [Penicillium hispanicum]KAJ5580249.1 hypothetical protein N7459_006234 [Penicillium hispanicum]
MQFTLVALMGLASLAIALPADPAIIDQTPDPARLDPSASTTSAPTAETGLSGNPWENIEHFGEIVSAEVAALKSSVATSTLVASTASPAPSGSVEPRFLIRVSDSAIPAATEAPHPRERVPI